MVTVLAAVGDLRIVISVAAEVTRIDGLGRLSQTEVEPMDTKDRYVIKPRNQGAHFIEASREGDVLTFNCNARTAKWSPRHVS